MSDPMSPAMEDATIAMLQAQTLMFAGQAADYAASVEIKKAEARQKSAHADAAVFGAEQMRVQTEATLRSEQLSLASNHLHHEYTFWDEVRDGSVDTCLSQLAAWDRLDKNCPMHIIMNSPGGNVDAGMHLYDQLAKYSLRGPKGDGVDGGNHKITITVRALAASMAGILLQAADERVMGPRSYLMIHQVSSWAQGSLGQIKDTVKWLDMLSDDVVEIFMSRATDKITEDEFRHNWERKDWYLTPKQAVEFGFADRVG